MFTLYEDPARGVKTVGWFEPDGRITVQVRQYVPDSFKKQVQVMRDTYDPKSHYRPVSLMPDTMKSKLLVDGNGRPFDLRDPDREKKMKEIDNDIDYRDFRVWEGRV